jgi:hypothetical protein
MLNPRPSRLLRRIRWQGLLCAVLTVCATLPGTAGAAPWPLNNLPQPPGLPRPPGNPWDNDQQRQRDNDTARQRQWQEQQQREARERNDRDSRWGRDERRDDRFDDRWGRRWDNHYERWYGGPARPPVVVHRVRPRYGVVVPILPWAATVLLVGGATYWYCDGVYYRRLSADAGYQVVDEPVGQARVLDERLYVYPRKGQSAEQQARDEYDCHRWAVDQTGFDPTAAATGDATDLDRRDDYRRAQSACLDGRGYTVK